MCSFSHQNKLYSILGKSRFPPKKRFITPTAASTAASTDAIATNNINNNNTNFCDRYQMNTERGGNKENIFAPLLLLVILISTNGWVAVAGRPNVIVWSATTSAHSMFKWFLEETRVPESVSLNPSTGYVYPKGCKRLCL